MQERLSKFLFQYRLMPHCTTGITPATHAHGTQAKVSLYLIWLRESRKRQEKQKEIRGGATPLHTFQVGDNVYAQNFAAKTPKWLAGTIIEAFGSRSYKIELTDGVAVRRHIDSIRRTDGFDKSPEHPSDRVEQMVVRLRCSFFN